MRIAPSRGAQVLLTGATGFVGKVVLEELLRRRGELGVETVYVLIRQKKDKPAQKRFDDEIASAKCFDLLPEDWTRHVKVVHGELTWRDCGLSDNDLQLLTTRVTHLIHCAASVEFDLPLHQAAAANITSALHVLELAKRCKGLRSMVDVSTAYVTPWKSASEPVHETLVPLHRAASSIYRAIQDGTADEKALLRETGHPNTYTFTKCVAEHLLMEHKGDVPLTIVRPSIVSATWRHPFPGWIDSAAAFAGFVALIGAGHMRALVADRNARLDVVPCDVVSDRVIDAAFAAHPPAHPAIRFAVAGLEHCCRVDTSVDVITRFFRRHPIDRVPAVTYLGPPSQRFRLAEMAQHTAPSRLAGTLATLQGNKRMQKAAKKVAEKLTYVNRAFPYFTHNTFDFRATDRLDDPLFRREEYVETICRGVYRHLMRKDETEMSLAGRHHREPGTDLQFVLGRPHGNWAIRTFGYAVRKALRQCTSQVTFDRPSFEAALDAAAPGSLLVIVPTHRSYMDFLLCSYLFFARPDLGVPIPHIAAAEEFSRIPILGKLFQKTHAFYLRRGQGKVDAELTRHVHGLVEQRQTLQFFIEGARSRSRQFLAPKHGLLRCLQATGETFTILPVAISYDRVPEEQSLLRELRGSPRPEMQLRALLAWTTRMARGQVSLGRVHLRCGEPVVMRKDAEVHTISREVMARLQEATVATTHHLRCFLHHNALPGVDLDYLRDALERRGGQVVDSPLGGEDAIDPVTEHCLRYNWMHLFYPEALAVWPDHPAIGHHTRHNGFHLHERTPDPEELADPRMRGLLRALFEPVARDYARVAERLGPVQWPPRHATSRTLLYDVPDAHLPNLQAAFLDLVERGVLTSDRQGRHEWGPNAAEIDSYKQACVWPDDRELHRSLVA